MLCRDVAVELCLLLVCSNSLLKEGSAAEESVEGVVLVLVVEGLSWYLTGTELQRPMMTDAVWFVGCGGLWLMKGEVGVWFWQGAWLGAG